MSLERNGRLWNRLWSRPQGRVLGRFAISFICLCGLLAAAPTRARAAEAAPPAAVALPASPALSSDPVAAALSPSPSTAAGPVLTPAICAEITRARLRDGLAFSPSGRPDLDAAMERLDAAMKWRAAESDRFSFEISNAARRTTELSRDRSYASPSGDERVERSVRLTLAPIAGGATELRVRLEAKRYRAVDGAEIAVESAQETFAASAPGCGLEARDWSATLLAPSDVGSRWLARQIVAGRSGGADRSSSRLVPLDFLKNARVAELLSRSPGQIVRPLRLFVFVGVDSPDALLEVDPLEGAAPAFDAITGEVRSMRQARVATLFAGKAVFEGKLRWSPADGYSSLASDASEERVVDEIAWMRERLDASEASAQIEVRIEAAALAGPNARAVLRLNKPIEFANFAQYWTIESTDAPALPRAGRAPRWTYALRATELQGLEAAAAAPVVPPEDRWGRPELRATKWIQAELPLIRAAAAEAANASNGTRLDVAAKTLAATNALLPGKFDGKMADDDAIPPMTTSEILARARGVCQHFANVFVAIARAAGLPARIVAGARLDKTASDSSAKLHAWAEFEAVDGGPWIPVEPQSQAIALPTGRYLPLAISAALDDPSDEAALAAEMATFFELRGTLSAP